jgi:dihydrofolate reductase
MAASLDGFIARKDGSVDWLETSDRFDGGEVLAPEAVAEFLRTMDCYVIGSRTCETALDFETRGGAVSGECLRRGLTDEVRYSILPILLIGAGIATSRESTGTLPCICSR